ncbi:MAG TPA: hypothetical protein VLB46_06955 [Pyrinomonadaceae bacterium]|nr:hypothetical protein [Pyrinomonadaceae bacterium]
MKEIIIRVDDELYERARRAHDDVDSSIEERVTSYLEDLSGEDTQISAARLRMKELFNTTKGFGVGQKPSREELHERGRLH